MSVPQLRFKKFSALWKKEKIQKLINSIDSGWSPLCEVYSANSEEWGVLKTTSTTWAGFNDSENKKLPSKFQPRSQFEVVSGDILITRAGPVDRVGVVCHVDKTRPKLMLSDKLIRLKCNEHTSSKFLAKILGAREAQIQLESLKSGLAAAQTNISQSGILSIEVTIPERDEQTKIANFLTAVDEKIVQLTQKFDLLTQYKKGVMQKIFSQELRFKDDDGRDFPDWTPTTLGKISGDEAMYGMNAAAIPFDGKHKYIRITDIDEDSRAFTPNPLCSPSGNIEKKYKLKTGDLLFARTGASVGKSYQYKTEDGNLHFAGFLVKFSIKHANSTFVFFQTQTDHYKSWVTIMSMRSGQPGINAEEYKDFQFQLPSQLEQTKIANFLTAVDEKITNARTQLEATKQYKQGLLQQMFI